MNEHYTIPLPPVTKKNSSQIIFTGQKCPVCKRGRLARLLPSKKYREYEEAALWFLKRGRPINTPVNVQCLFFMPTKRKVDKSNLEEACHDLLVIAGVLADDNRDIIAATDGSRVLYDKENPRTEIYITDYKEAYEQWQHR